MCVLYYTVGQMDFVKGAHIGFYQRRSHVCFSIQFLFQPTFAPPLNNFFFESASI